MADAKAFRLSRTAKNQFRRVRCADHSVLTCHIVARPVGGLGASGWSAERTLLGLPARRRCYRRRDPFRVRPGGPPPGEVGEAMIVGGSHHQMICEDSWA